MYIRQDVISEILMIIITLRPKYRNKSETKGVSTILTPITFNIFNYTTRPAQRLNDNSLIKIK